MEKMNNGKPMRAVICYDIEIDGGLSDAAKFEMLLKDYSKDFEQYLKKNNPDLAKIVNFSQEQAEVPMQERRGATGSLGDIVFRGSRVTSTNNATKEWLVLSSNPIEIHVKGNPGMPHEGRVFIYPVDQLPTPMRKYFRNPGAMDGKSINIPGSRMLAFGTPK